MEGYEAWPALCILNVPSLLVEAVGHVLDEERSVIVGELDVAPSIAVNGIGIFVFQIDGKPAVEVDLAIGCATTADLSRKIFSPRPLPRSIG